MIRPFPLILPLLLGLQLPTSHTPLLLQTPTVSAVDVAFVYGGDLWLVSRAGGDARRLTTGVGEETDPSFSPDGSTIAFAADYDGNADVYVIPAAGGQPRRLTYHPGADAVVGWSPDGREVLFRSRRHSFNRSFSRLFTVSVEGGLPSELPLPMAEFGSYAPDASRLAYEPLERVAANWTNYRGGRTSAIWLATLSDSRVETIPRQNSNDFSPAWVGDRVFFLSDRNGPVTLFSFDSRTKEVRQVLPTGSTDIKSMSAGPGVIAYAQLGSLHLLDLLSGKTRQLSVTIKGDMPRLRPRFQDATGQIQNGAISPSGARVVFEARGDILTVPASKGDIRNLTNTPGAAERDPSWSPDGKWIAYFSDQAGEYALHLRDQAGRGTPRVIELGSPPSFYYSPRWAPDSKKIAYTDKRLNLWYVQVDGGAPVRIDTDYYEGIERTIDPAWSPDGQWIAYTKRSRNYMAAVFVYSLKAQTTHQITDGESDARFPAFDKGGKYLYFTATTDLGPAAAWVDLSAANRLVTRAVYAVVLRRDDPSPMAPETDEEKTSIARTPDADGAVPATVQVDLDDIRQRIVALPIPARNYLRILSGTPGALFLVEGDPVGGGPTDSGTFAVRRFTVDTRELDTLLVGISRFDLSHDGEKMLYVRDGRWLTSSVSGPASGQDRALNLDGIQVLVDPRAEWRQIYREVWRIERDFFYDPGHHGYNIAAAQRRYEPYLDNLASRGDLNYLMREMLRDLSVSHLSVGGGDPAGSGSVRGGLLGADYRIENGRYRFLRVYDADPWSQIHAPLRQPGASVTAGEYLLEVNGQDLRAPDNLYRHFEQTAGKTITLKVGPDPGGAGSREVTVTPVPDESGLRHHRWIDTNRRRVDELSAGKIAYVHIPDTGARGYSSFNRYYFAQVGKEGLVVDNRFNGGGRVPDYVIDYLRRPLMNYLSTREGHDFTTPMASIFGPKAMIVNEYSGSGGDSLGWFFRKAELGPLVGKRTWGGLVGIYDYPVLMDGGSVTAPRIAFWTTKGEWEIENHGVPPDIEVELDPEAVRSGHDPQLEKATLLVLEEMKRRPQPAPRRPAYPKY